MKQKFGKYKAKEVDAFLAEEAHKHEEQVKELKEKIAALEAEKAELQKQLDALKSREGMIAQVMLDATQRAKDIEEGSRARAAQSDAEYEQLRGEWVTGMEALAGNMARMRAEAKKMLEDIDGQFTGLCQWADTRLEGLQQISLPEKGEMQAGEAASETEGSAAEAAVPDADIPFSTTDNSATGEALEREIAAGAGADLAEVCRELGLMQDAAEPQDSTADTVPVTDEA